MTARVHCLAATALGAALCLALPARAAPPGPRDADWPCAQIKVPRLSLASMWSGPPLEQQPGEWRQNQQIADLVETISQRRLPIEQAEAMIRSFAQQSGEQKQPMLLQLLDGVFNVLDDDRSSVISGLDRFGARQKELAADLRDDNEKLRAMQADPQPDAGEINQMTQRVTWEAQVFQDRRQSLRYACDVPSKIEQRLFMLARAIQQALQ